MTFSQDLSGVAADGCGDGFNALLDDLRDIKGDTDDLVYGLLPTGTPLTGVAGCGGSGAGTGVVGDGDTAAHEAGHAVGRKHVPCDASMRCDSPRNTDDDYPTYGNFVSDSIGEFGFDPENNRVFDPAVSSDFMGYSSSDWISPYTYKALFAQGDPVGGAAGPRTFAFSFAATAAVDGPALDGSDRRRRAEWIKRRAPLLFLSVYVDGQSVKIKPSFTYDAHVRRPGPDTEYEVHLIGPKDEVLACTPLQQACGACIVGCGPLQLRGEIPWTDGATKLVVRRGGEDLETFPIEDKPMLKAQCEREDKGDIRVWWSAKSDSNALWYLVQWRDRDGTWRGCAPRTQANSLTVSGRLL